MSSTGYVAWAVTAGEQPTTAYWNILGTNDASFNTGAGFNDAIITTRHLASGIQVAPAESNPYKFYAYANSAWTTGNNGFVKVPLNAELYDTGNNFDSVTNFRFVAPVAGFYHFTGATAYTGNAGGAGQIVSIRRNGAFDFVGMQFVDSFSGGFGRQLPASADIQMAVNDYVELFNYGNALVGGTGSGSTFLSGYLVSAT